MIAVPHSLILLKKYLIFLLWFFLIQGVIDIPKEVSKLENKKENLMQTLQKLIEATQIPDYQTKVPEKVQQQNADKVLNNAVMATANLSIAHFKFRKRKRKSKRKANYLAIVLMLALSLRCTVFTGT